MMIDKRYATHDHLPFFLVALKYYTEGMSVVDVGGGDGTFANLIPNKNDVTVLEGNPQSVKYLEHLGFNVVEHVLPETLPFNRGEISLVHVSHVIEHLQPDQLYCALQEFDRILADEGYLIISAPLYWDLFYADLSHVRPYTPEIFYKYLCSNDKRNRTKSLISSNYVVVELVYRYLEFPKDNIVISSVTNSLIGKSLAFCLQKIINRFSIRRYQRTGYTLVLKKETTGC